MKHKYLLLTLPFAFQLLYSPVTLSAASIEEVYEYVEEPAKAPEPVYQDPTGVQVKFNDDGTMRAIIATGESELRFGDRKDIRQALKKSTLRAKAEIAKFMRESIVSEDVMNEITKVASKAAEQGDTEATRETVESQVETIQNSANAILSGIVTLSQDINKDEKYVTVVVGVKEQTINAASKISRQIKSGLVKSQQYKPNSSGSNHTSSARNNHAGGREIRRSSMYDDF